MALSFDLDDAEKEYLCKQAKLAISSALDMDGEANPLHLTPGEVAECARNLKDSPLNRNLGSFVTLHLNGNLRGCIGTIVGHEPLYLNVWNMARAAAFQDPRFPPLTKGEWANIKMEISVLDAPTPCPDPKQIAIGRDGLILQCQGHSGVFLPQVPVEQGWSQMEYLDNLCLKAGLPVGTWKRPDARLYWYQALVFQCA